jgi:DNA mismatch repair protein MutS
MYNKEQLNGMERSELEKIATELGIKDVNKITDEELTFGILDAQASAFASNATEAEKPATRKRSRVSVKNVDGKVIFLRRLERGGSEHSFGIHVAEIAGMPKSIVKRANTVLAQLEQANSQKGAVGKPQAAAIEQTREGMQLSFFQLDDPVLCQIRDEILGLDINNLTPVEALNKLNEIKKIVSGKN